MEYIRIKVNDCGIGKKLFSVGIKSRSVWRSRPAPIIYMYIIKATLFELSFSCVGYQVSSICCTIIPLDFSNWGQIFTVSYSLRDELWESKYKSSWV